MGPRIMAECPQCGERFIVENDCEGGWVSTDRCPKCGCFIMKS